MALGAALSTIQMLKSNETGFPKKTILLSFASFYSHSTTILFV
jgi:hypothetical protein